MTDAHGRRVGPGGIAVGGDGLGLVGLLIYVLISPLSTLAVSVNSSRSTTSR